VFNLVSVGFLLHPTKTSIQILLAIKGVKVETPCAKKKTNQEVPPFVILHNRT